MARKATCVESASSAKQVQLNASIVHHGTDISRAVVVPTSFTIATASQYPRRRRAASAEWLVYRKACAWASTPLFWAFQKLMCRAAEAVLKGLEEG
ncbi:hypothetical protein PsYK624_013950 [Phanerochaete sordida]|uniref:Uncharacterized protein n=1 Tax=Phanerochaete sordida TaxID=48140 RepID=A0A9P3L7Q5_9APHY|nr:hypothetical protein PsYK624_013950 [Phanerochaete sordida]